MHGPLNVKYIVYNTIITNKFRVKIIGLSTVNYTSLNVDISRKRNILQSFCLKQRKVSNWYVHELFDQFAVCFCFHKKGEVSQV